MGRRNWQQTGSHFTTQNTAFMFGLITRILWGEEVDASFLPCGYVRHYKDGMDTKITKLS